MNRAIWTLTVAAVVVLVSVGAASACGEAAKAQPSVAQADAKGGCGKAMVAGKADCDKADCDKADCGKGNCDMADCAKADGAKAGVAMADHGKGGCGKGEMVAKGAGAAVAAEAVPCAGAAGTGCAKKAKATEIAKADEAKPVELVENTK